MMWKTRTAIICFALFTGSFALLSCQSAQDKGTGSDGASQELQVGRALAARLIFKYGLIKNKKQTEYLNLVGHAVSRLSSRPELEFYFGILNSSDVNAFACPGGYILITKGALDLMDNEAQLAGVLAHEITHVSLRHSGKFAVKETSWAEFVGGMMGGGIVNSAFHQVTGELEKTLLEKGREKNLEFEADQAGLLLAWTVGYNPTAIIDFMQKMASANLSKRRIKTHPGTGSRITRIKAFLKNQQIPDSGQLNAGRFKKIFPGKN